MFINWLRYSSDEKFSFRFYFFVLLRAITSIKIVEVLVNVLFLACRKWQFLAYFKAF